MTTKTNCTTAGASLVMPAAGQDLEQTIASDLPYTENGLLDLGVLCRNASRFSANRRINRVRQAIYGSHSIVDVLHAGDDSLCSMSANVHSGLLNALRTIAPRTPKACSPSSTRRFSSGRFISYKSPNIMLHTI